MKKKPVKIDQIDKKILIELIKDADATYADIGQKIYASSGTVHIRVKKMLDSGIILSKNMKLNLRDLGFDINAFIGIFLERSSLYASVVKEISKIPEVVRVNHTTGVYSMFIEVICRDMNHLTELLNDHIQIIKGVLRTETFLSLEEYVNRDISINLVEEK